MVRKIGSYPVNIGSSPIAGTIYAGVVELVDTLVLETSAERREGSSPSTGTKIGPSPSWLRHATLTPASQVRVLPALPS